MSLINRMLNDLASRQAPGADVMSGVRLNEPMSVSPVQSRSLWLLLLIGLAVTAALLWYFWPRVTVPPAPQLRLAPTLADHLEAQTGTEPAGSRSNLSAQASTSNASEVTALAAAQVQDAPKLKLASALVLPEGLHQATLRADQQPLTKAVVVDVLEPSPKRQAPPARKVEIAKPEPSQPRSRPSAEPKAKPPQPSESEPPPGTGPSASSQARAWLAAGNALAALDALGAPVADESTEVLALRAASLQRLQRYDEAAALYGQLTQAQPRQAAHWVGLGISLEGSGKAEQARVAYNRALADERLAPSLRNFARTRFTELSRRP